MDNVMVNCFFTVTADTKIVQNALNLYANLSIHTDKATSKLSQGVLTRIK